MKRVLAICLMLTLLLVPLGSLHVSAATVDISTIPAAIAAEFDVVEENVDIVIPLYNADETVVAYCLRFRSTGYVIYDLDGIVVQYSPTDACPISSSSGKIYYGGPAMYFRKSGNHFTHILNSQHRVTKANFVRDNAVTKAMQTRAATPSEIYSGAAAAPTASKRTTYTPRNWSYNPTGICAGTAAAILLAYYDDYIHGGTVPNLYMTSDGKSLTKLLANRIYNLPSGWSYTAHTREVLKWFIKNYSTGTAKNFSSSSSEGSWSTVYAFVKTVIGSNRPLQTYIADGDFNHGVCVYGWEDVSGSSRIRCSDGWGGTNAYFNATFLYGGMRITGG